MDKIHGNKIVKVRQMLAIGKIEPLLPMDSELVPLLELASDLRAESILLLSHVGERSRPMLASMLRAMNSYYSNKIEGQHTYPADLDDALHRHFSADAEIHKRQILALAHMAVEEEFEARARTMTWDAMFTQEWISDLHASLYARLQEESHIVLDQHGRERGRFQPGALRRHAVKVGAHIPPEHKLLPDLLTHFHGRYGKVHYRDVSKIVVAGASLHRLSWIHPFMDGNGRVSRLHNHVLLHHLGLTDGLWSPMRGLARKQEEYYGALHQADLPRRNATDGRGELSSKGLADFIRFWLDTCLDQVRFMGQLLRFTEMEARYVNLALLFAHGFGREPVPHHRSILRPELLGKVLYRLFRAGQMERSEFKAALDISDRTATRLISRLLEQRLIVSQGRVGVLQPGFPLGSFRYLFPGLWPEAEVLEMPPIGGE